MDVPGRGPAATEIHVGPGLLARLGVLVARSLPAHRYAVVADRTVASLYADTAMAALADANLEADLYTFPAGEAHKTRSTWRELTDRMLRDGFGRDTAIVALGGGVTGDLAGFVAATYMRGIEWAVVPTTLLAMLDSSVGGKTGVDTPFGKNTVGAFHHPRLVVADPATLRSLPDPERRAGLAEAVKTAAIRDADLFERIEADAARLASGDDEALADVVAACLGIKADVVAEDPREAGVRAVLNFGHTIGHALELLANYGVRHGEAVAAGQVVEALLGERVGLTEPGTARRISDALEACGLPDLLRPEEAERRFRGLPDGSRILEAAAGDKKGRRGRTRFVLLERIGQVARAKGGRWTHGIEPAVVEDVVAGALRARADVRDSAS